MDLTPIELRNGLVYKRDDLHVGPGGTNGAKLRACEHLLGTAAKRGATAFVTAASVLSPQHAIVANTARRLHVPAYHIVGATNPKSAMKHPSVLSAYEAGAEFHFIGCAYNNALQLAARKMRDEIPGSYLLHYGITTPPNASPEAIRQFAEVGAAQVKNLPADLRTLVVPFGSGNSATGILTGLAAERPDIEVKLIGVGPSRMDWMIKRLRSIGIPKSSLPPIEHIDLHAMKYAKYSDRMPESQDGIEFHPTYEGKCIRYLNETKPSWWRRDGKTGFWIIGAPVGTKAPAKRKKVSR